MKPRTASQLKHQIDDWNSQYPVGTAVRFHPVIGGPAYRERKTRTEAYVLSGHTACIFLEGESGCVALDACEPIDKAEGRS